MIFLTRGFCTANLIYYLISSDMTIIMIMSPAPSTSSSSQLYKPYTKSIPGTTVMVEVLERLGLTGEQRQAGWPPVQCQRQETSMTADQNMVNSGFIPGPPSIAQANRAHKAQERKLARLREREQKQALRDQEDEQRRRDRQARDESAAQALLRYEAREAQEKEQRRVFALNKKPRRHKKQRSVS